MGSVDTEIDVLSYQPGTLRILDQTRLPAEEIRLGLHTSADVAEAIRSLRVRGAPLIGIAGAYALALAEHSGGRGAVEDAAPDVRAARPTAVNLGRAVDRVLDRVRRDPTPGAAADEARAIHAFEADACRRMGELGASLLGPQARVLTYCNTGTLATGGIGTALGVIRTAHARGDLAHTWVPETRPLLQGARLTAWELGRLGVPHTLVADAASGAVFAAGQLDAVVVGADRIAANGDTANKVGTYVLAVLAARHGVPFYVVAPTSTIDRETATGAAIPIEERHADEVRAFLGVASAPAGAPVANPAFDVTPAELITAIVTEDTVHYPPYAL